MNMCIYIYIERERERASLSARASEGAQWLQAFRFRTLLTSLHFGCVGVPEDEFQWRKYRVYAP